MKKKKGRGGLVNVLVFIIAYGIAFQAGRTGDYLFSGFVLIALAVFLFLRYYRRSGQILDMAAVFSLTWNGGVGLSAMKLSNLAEDWSTMTWACFALTWLCFMIGYDGTEVLAESRKRKRGLRETGKAGSRSVPAAEGGAAVQLRTEMRGQRSVIRVREGVDLRAERKAQAKKIVICIIAILAVSWAAFILEAAVLKEVPLFSDKPHAYSYFHLSGVHYFTVTSIFVLPLSVLYGSLTGRPGKKQTILLVLACVAALMIPILCVSRFQMMLGILLSFCMILIRYPRIRFDSLAGGALLMVVLYVGLTVARNHDVAYLNGIFSMKNAKTPIFVTQPYMYVANNYDNFNCLVQRLPEHTFGMRQLFPLFALTGLKFLRPELVSFPLYVNKKELTTLTLIYDAYYDFGILGVVLFALLLGAACCLIRRMTQRDHNPIAPLFYAQIAMYLAFSFFTTWFSNPTTWFWLAITAILYVYVGYKKKA